MPPDAIPLTPATEKGLTAAELRQSQDVQLLRALDLLTRKSRYEGRWSTG